MIFNICFFFFSLEDWVWWWLLVGLLDHVAFLIEFHWKLGSVGWMWFVFSMSVIVHIAGVFDPEGVCLSPSVCWVNQSCLLCLGCSFVWNVESNGRLHVCLSSSSSFVRQSGLCSWLHASYASVVNKEGEKKLCAYGWAWVCLCVSVRGFDLKNDTASSWSM